MTPIEQKDSFGIGTWTQSYHYQTQQTNLAPIYVLLIARNHAISAGTDFSTEIDLEPDDGFVAEPFLDTYFAYDGDDWELLTATRFQEDLGPFVLDKLSGTTRAAYNSNRLLSVDTFRVCRIWKAFSTHDLSSIAGTFPHSVVMSMPSGHGSTLLYQEGRTQYRPVTCEVQDRDGEVSRAFGGLNIIGKPAIILGGYAGQPFKAFSMLYIAHVSAVDYQSGIYSFELSVGEDKLNKELFGQIEDFSVDGIATQASQIDPGDTSLTLGDDSNTYKQGTFDTLSGGRFIACYFHVTKKSTGEVEYMRQLGTGTPPTYNVTRAQLGTTALTFPAGDHEIRYVLSFQDNPINILLKLLLSTKFDRFTYQHATYDLNALSSVTTGDSLGLAWNINDIDIESFEDARDDWFPTDLWRVEFTKRTNMKQWIEKHLLKVLGSCLYINKSGQLSLAVIHPPITGETTLALSEANTAGPPAVAYTTDEIVNDVSVQWDYDVVGRDFAQTTRIINATSQGTYDVDRPMTLEAQGVSPLYSGSILAKRYGNKRTTYFSKPSPTISLSVLMNEGALIEPGSVQYLDHAKIPDIDRGRVDTERYVLIAEKAINWRSGTVDIRCLPFLWTASRVGLIGPAALSNYPSATEDERARYMFVSNSAGLMSDGTPGYVVY